MQSIKQRRFNFFDKTLIKDPQDGKKNFDSLKNLNIKYSLSGRGLIIYGTVDGSIITLNKQLEINSFQLFDIDLTALTQFKNDSIVVAAGVSKSPMKFYEF